MAIDIDKARQTIAEIQSYLHEMGKVLKEAKKGKISESLDISGFDSTSFNYSNAQKQALKDKYTYLKDIVEDLFSTLP